MRRGKKRSRYARRERFFEYMGWVKTLPCVLIRNGVCAGSIEADHAGSRALSQKAHDSTCIPLCTRHHRDRTDYRGVFVGFDAERMRTWCDEQIAKTHEAAEREGVEVPLSDP
jgi:hypothetical protein